MADTGGSSPILIRALYGTSDKELEWISTGEVHEPARCTLTPHQPIRKARHIDHVDARAGKAAARIHRARAFGTSLLITANMKTVSSGATAGLSLALLPPAAALC